MLDQIRIFPQLYNRPARAFGEILDKGSLTFAAVAAIAVAVALQSLSLLVPIAVLFVPAAVIIIAAWTGRGSAGVALQRDYAPMLACTLMAWAASHLPIIPFMYVAQDYLPWARIAAAVYFALLAAIAIQTVAGAAFMQAAVTAFGSIAAAIGGYFAWGQLGGLPYMFMSPFILIWLYPMIRSNMQSVSGGLRSRQSFRRNLEAATLNPHDADAHFQLGLIYQDRRNFTEAIARFKKAIEIDPSDAGPHYQLGRIAREQNRMQDALTHLAEAHRLDPKHSSGEVWRDLGATYVELGQIELARQFLEPYVERREYDPQGLYWLGRVYKTTNRPADARTMFERAMEAAKTAPPHLRRQNAKWIGQSRSEMKSLP